MAQNFYNQLIESDWMGRCPADYTYTKKGHSFGWEETLTSGEAYSSFIIKVPTEQKHIPIGKQILLAKQACSSILNRMLINSGKTKSRIIFSDDFNNYANRSENLICVTLEPLKEDNKIKFDSFNHALDPILGYTAHEVAHILYTDDEYTNHIMKFKGVEARLKATIMNILEDERIEKNIAENFRGYTHYIAKAKDYCFGKKFAEETSKIPDDVDDVNLLVGTFLHLVRYPRALREDQVNKFEPEIKEFQAILAEYPATIAELIQATEKIYLIFLRYFKQQPTEDPGDGNDQKNDQKNKAKAQTGGGNINSDKGDSEAGDSEAGDSEAGDSEAGEDDGDGGGDPLEGMSESEIQELGKALAEALEHMLEAVENAQPSSGGTSEEVMRMLLSKSNLPYGVLEAIKAVNSFDNSDMSMRGSDTHLIPELRNLGSNEMNVLFQDADKNVTTTNHYDEALSEVKSYSSSLRAKLQQLNRNQSVINSGLSEGDFDDGLLVDALVGSKNVYSQEFKMINRGVCIGLLIDESGSMEAKQRWFSAMKIAVMFERALYGVNNIDFFCYGHTTGIDRTRLDTTVINSYFEGRKKSNKKNLGKIYHHGTNRDGHAIIETVARIKKNIDKDMPLVLFMISDGEPSASVPHGYTQVQYVKKCVDTVERDLNTTIIHIAIHQNIRSEDMFNNYVKFTDFRTLVKDVGGILKKVVTVHQQAITI